MKKLYIGFAITAYLLISAAFTEKINAQETVYNENFGFPADKSTDLDQYTGFQANTNVIKYTGTVDVRNNKASDTYEGASAGGNIYFNDGPQEFMITGINTTGYLDAKFSLGLWYQLQGGGTQSTAIYAPFTIEYSTDMGATYKKLALPITEITEAPIADGTSKDGAWILVKDITLPTNVNNLYLRFTKMTNMVNYRIDDLKIVGNKNVDVTLTSNPSYLTFSDTILAGESTSKKINIKGNAKATTKLEFAYGTNFQVSKSTLTKEEVNAGVDVTLTFAPQEANNEILEYLYVSTEGANKLEIAITGSSKLKTPTALAVKNYQTTENSFVANWQEVPGAEKYLIYIYSLQGSGTETVILSENFSRMVATDGKQIGDRLDNSGSLDKYTLTPGWTGTMIYLGSDDDLIDQEGVVRVGKKDAAGQITTPAVNLTANNGKATVKFKLRSFAKLDENDEVMIFHLVDGVIKDTLDDLKNLFPETFEYSYQIKGGTSNSQIRIQAKKEKDNRFILESMQIVQGGIQKVYNKTNKSTKGYTYNISTKVCSFECDDLNSGTNYFYSIRSYAKASFFAPISNEIEVLTKGVNSEKVEKEVAPEAFTISSNAGNIEIDGVEIGESVFIYNILGVLEHEYISDGTKAIVPTKKGIYMVKAKGQTKKINVK